MRSKAIILVLLAVCICGSLTSKFEEPLLYEKFPPGFIWAAGSSAYQVEGGWDADGKGLSIWDTFTANASAITQGATGKIACDSYHLYQKDVELLKSLNVTHYRFSISWSRILPDGVGMINQAGLSYYRRLVASLNAANIKPMIVLYFWDLPQALEDKGGWLNPKTIDWFVEYARVCFTELGNNVQLWITINDPWTVAKKGYGDGTLAPGKYGPGTYTYKVGRNLLLAHAKVYRLYQESFKAIQKGKVGIGLNSRWYQSKDNKTENIDAAERAMMFMIGWFANPIFGSGDYPSIMKQKIGEKSRLQNLTNPSRLPELTADEQRLVKGSSDFLGLTHYTSTLVENQPSNKSDISYDADQDVKTSYDPDWPATETSWLKIAPLGIKYTLQWVKDRFNNPEVIIIDNGISDRGGGNTNDMQRIFSLKYYLNNVLRAVKSGVNVTGYTTTLMDSFDWVSGYKEKFGLFVVNFSSPELTRTAKASSKYYAQIIRDNGFVKYDNQSCTSSSQTKEKGSCSASTSTHSQHSSAAVMAITLIFMLSIAFL